MTVELERQRAEALLAAQKNAAALFAEIEATGLIRPGATESQVSKEIFRLSRDRFNAGRHWHKRVIRTGPNTVHPYQIDPEDRVIAEDDIVYLDLGPVFEEWEADFGRTYVLGNDRRKQALSRLVGAVFAEGKAYFDAHADITGAELYAKVTAMAEREGWDFGNGHAGHIVGEFPHEKIIGDKITLYIHPENHQPLRALDQFGRRRHWILEIHLVDREKRYGAFFEELLTL
jgi:Xaa-Pro aminopeptidase